VKFVPHGRVESSMIRTEFCISLSFRELGEPHTMRDVLADRVADCLVECHFDGSKVEWKIGREVLTDVVIMFLIPE